MKAALEAHACSKVNMPSAHLRRLRNVLIKHEYATRIVLTLLLAAGMYLLWNVLTRKSEYRPENQTAAALGIMRTQLSVIASDKPEGWTPKDMSELVEYLRVNGYHPSSELMKRGDFWGRDYFLRWEATRAGKNIVIGSLGEDGKRGTSDDMEITVEFQK